MIDGLNRCAWVKNNPLEIAYHDHEWGMPLHDDQRLSRRAQLNIR